MLNRLLIDFRITSNCPYECGLCFRNPGIADLQHEEVLNIITKLRDVGITKIGFTGGEPTLRSDYIYLIQFAKKANMLTYLSTIGRSFTRDIVQLDGILDWVGLPLDAVDPSINEIVRSSTVADQHIVISDIFHYLSGHSTNIKIKLSTVVTKANFEHLDVLATFLSQYSDKINAWRIYQFCPLGLGKERRDLMEIETPKFISATRKLTDKYPQLQISTATFEERNKANLIIEPNGDLIIPDYDNYKYLCNILNDSADSIKNIIESDVGILIQCDNNRKWMT